jgi:DnaJ domain
MPCVHTHYDNLKVVRDAPMEVIHAAYRSLAAMYHPDRNGGSEEAARIMRIIDNSFASHCDPVRKRDHDRWISESLEPEPPPAEPKVRKQSAPIIDVPLAPIPGRHRHWMWLVSGGIFASVTEIDMNQYRWVIAAPLAMLALEVAVALSQHPVLGGEIVAVALELLRRKL